MIPNKHEQELEADALGAALTLEHMLSDLKYDLAISFMGIDYFFACLEVLERLQTRLPGRQAETSSTHPPAAERRNQVRLGITKALPLEAGGSAVPLDLGDIVHHLVLRLGEYSEPFLEMIGAFDPAPEQ